MPFVTLHTRLFSLLNEANFVRQTCAEHIAQMASGNVSANVVVGLAQRFQVSLANVVAPLDGDADLVTYADEQFAGVPGWVPLNLQIPGITALVSAVISECRACVPMDGAGRILKDTWNEDGSVSVLALTPAETADLRAAMQAVANAIPE
jgi:hypothetical protein